MENEHNKYIRGRVLGEGTWGVVFEAKRKSDDVRLAVKRIKHKDPKEGLVFTALREIKFLKELQHNNIVEVTYVNYP